jgi:hypothetical protein
MVRPLKGQLNSELVTITILFGTRIALCFMGGELLKNFFADYPRPGCWSDHRSRRELRDQSSCRQGPQLDFELRTRVSGRELPQKTVIFELKNAPGFCF